VFVIISRKGEFLEMLADANYATAMINELNHRLGNDTSIAHAAQVLKTDETPSTNQG
jgi:hypothetical protein